MNLITKIRGNKFLFFRSTINIFVIMSFIWGQVAYAGMLDQATGNGDNRTKDDDTQDGFISEDYVKTLQGREAWQQQKLKDMEQVRNLGAAINPGEGLNLLDKLLKKNEDTTREIQAVNEMKNQVDLRNLRSTSEKYANLIQSYNKHYTKYNDGKMVWIDKGLVSEVWNEHIRDKHGNLSIRNTVNMQYNEQKQMISYESETTDSLGNKTKVEWNSGKYWSAQDELTDPRKKEGTLAAFTEVRIDDFGVKDTTEWTEITSYTKADETSSDKYQDGQMASYKKKEWLSSSPDRIDETVTTNIEYLKREKIIQAPSDDPKDKDRRISEKDKYEILTTGYHEERTTFGVTTSRDWKNAKYNEYNELLYYEEHSKTLGVAADKVFDKATYDQYGRMTGYTETSSNYGSTTVTVRSGVKFNDKNQILGYEDDINADGITTKILKDSISYNIYNQINGYHEITSNSEGFNRDLIRSAIQYDSRGLMTHYIDCYIQNNIHNTIERSSITYNQNGFMVSYSESRREQASYDAPDGEHIDIDRVTTVDRLSTEYNGNGLESGYQEREVDPTGLITDITRRNITYQGDKMTGYEETRKIHCTLNQSSLPVNTVSL